MDEDLVQMLHSGGSRPLRIHLIGVAGSGMSGLASLLMELGHRVSGSDKVTTVETERMQRVGLDFSCPHSAEAVQDADLVVFSSAIREDNVALSAAGRLGIPVVRRAKALAGIMRGKKGIVIAGTHGKTTTSAMAAHVLRQAGVRSSHYVGAEIPVLGTNAHWDPKAEYMVAEGDESDATLVHFHPEHSVILNVEAEHLDFYDGIESIRLAFRILLEQTSGKVVYCASDPEAGDLCRQCEGAVSYGWDPECDYSAEVVELRDQSATFDAFRRGGKLGRIVLGIPGRHNVLNALSVVALATEMGVTFEAVARALESFRGARRRFETKYRSTALRVIDDYGHHPTELAATISTARSLEPNRLICLFQPHRYTRTKLLRHGFGKAFDGADAVFVTDVYPASEAPIPGISGQTIVDEIERAGGPAVFYEAGLERAHLAVGNFLEEGDLLLSLGAGNVHEAATRISRDMAVLDEVRAILDGEKAILRLYEPMNRHTTLRVGGPAQFWAEPLTVESFRRVAVFCRSRGIPVRVVGRGSNLLVRDGGISGMVLHPSKGAFAEVRVEGDRVIAGVGARLKTLSSVARSAGLSGFEWMEGIPGNVGGSLRMNAGAMGASTFDQVVSVRYLNAEGEVVEKGADEIESFYRNVPEFRDNYAVSAVFRGRPARREEIDFRMEESKNKRRETQPAAASAGCIFKNPDGCSAGMLVEQLGLKDEAVGGARVSEVHGNFIVNDGKASASEVLSLIDHIKETARRERDIELETEVQIVGDDELFAAGAYTKSEEC